MHGPSERLILIAPDSPANRDVITTTLRGAGFEIAVATTVEAALDLADEERSRSADEIERQVAARTADLSDALRALEDAKDALSREVERLEGELREARGQIERELSTPLIPITDRIMVMPMIGTMTEERADELLDTALRGVQTHNADVVIIDDVCTTGDSTVAAVKHSRDAGMNVLGAICLVDRLMGAQENLEGGLGCPFDAVFTLPELT